MCITLGNDPSSIFHVLSVKGLGKTFLSAVYCLTRCILYPGTKIIITAPTKSQGINVLEKLKTNYSLSYSQRLSLLILETRNL